MEENSVHKKKSAIIEKKKKIKIAVGLKEQNKSD